MGRTLPSATQLVTNEQDALAKFRRALRQEDQHILDDLFRAAYYHVAAIAYASHLLPFEAVLLAMLIQERKSNQHLETRLRHVELVLERLLGQEPDETERMDSGCLPLNSGGNDDLAD